MFRKNLPFPSSFFSLGRQLLSTSLNRVYLQETPGLLGTWAAELLCQPWASGSQRPSSFLPALVSCCCPHSAHPALHLRPSCLVLGEPDGRRGSLQPGGDAGHREPPSQPAWSLGLWLGCQHIVSILVALPSPCTADEERVARSQSCQLAASWGFPCAGGTSAHGEAVLSPQCIRAAEPR